MWFKPTHISLKFLVYFDYHSFLLVFASCACSCRKANQINVKLNDCKNLNPRRILCGANDRLLFSWTIFGVMVLKKSVTIFNLKFDTNLII